MDNLFDRLHAHIDSGESPENSIYGCLLKCHNDSDERPVHCEKTHLDAPFASDVDNMEVQDGGKEAFLQNAVGMKEERSLSFVIPKRKRVNTDVLVDVKVSSRDFQHEILPAITKSYRHPQSNSRFVYDHVQLVQNPELTNVYIERRREMRCCGYVDKDLSESFAFLCMDVDHEEETSRICRRGLHIGNSSTSCLGHPQMGIHLCKHADILRPSTLPSGYTGLLLVFKVIKGKVKSVVVNRSGTHLEPTPNYDCHVSSTTGNDLRDSNQQSLYESTQLYLYEYGDENVREVPRNACPVAVVRFTFTGSPKDIKSPEMGSPKFNLRSPLSVKPIGFSPKFTIRSPLSVKPIPSSPSCVKDKEQKYVVWDGNLTVKGLYACSVEMTSKAGPTKPSRIGKGINITHKMPIVQARKKYLQTVSVVGKHHEVYKNGYYINVCELRPDKPEGKPQFQKVMSYLGKHNCVAIKKLEKDVVLLLLTASELTFQLGLTKPHQYPVILYCIFLSTNSRKLGPELNRSIKQEKTSPPMATVLQTNMSPDPRLREKITGLRTSVSPDPRLRDSTTVLHRSKSPDPRLREKTQPLRISLPTSSSGPAVAFPVSPSSAYSSPGHIYSSPIHLQMPPPPSPGKSSKHTRLSPAVDPIGWGASSLPLLTLPPFCPSQPPPLTPPVLTPTSPIHSLRSPVSAPMSPVNHWALIPPPPLPHTISAARFHSPTVSPIHSPMSVPMSPSFSVQYCPVPPQLVHASTMYSPGKAFSQDLVGEARTPVQRRDSRPGGGLLSPVYPGTRESTPDRGESPMSQTPLTSSPRLPTQPPPKLQTPPSLPDHDCGGARFESTRHFSRIPPATSLLLADHVKIEFTRQAKKLDSVAIQALNKRAHGNINRALSTSPNSELTMSDSEINRIVKKLGAPIDDSIDASSSPTKQIPQTPCIEEALDMKELLNKSLLKSSEKKSEKFMASQRQEVNAMRQILNDSLCDKNLLKHGKVLLDDGKHQTKNLDRKSSVHKHSRISKSKSDDTVKSKMDHQKKQKSKTCSTESVKKDSKQKDQKATESVRQGDCKQKDQKAPESVRQGDSKQKDQKATESVRQGDSKQNDKKATESVRQGDSKEKHQKDFQHGHSTSSTKGDKHILPNNKHAQSSVGSKVSNLLEDAKALMVARLERTSGNAKDQKSDQCRSRSSSTSLHGEHQSKERNASGKVGECKSEGKSMELKVHKHTEQKSCEHTEQSAPITSKVRIFEENPKTVQTFTEKYEESCAKVQQSPAELRMSSNVKLKKVSNKKCTISIPTEVDVALPDDMFEVTAKELRQQPSKTNKSSISKARARAYSSNEIENCPSVSSEQSLSAPKKAKMDNNNIVKSNHWNTVNSDAVKKSSSTSVSMGTELSTESKLSFKITGSKSLLKKDLLSSNNAGKRGFKKCGKSSSSSSSSSSSVRRKETAKEKRKIKSWVDTNREKHSIADVLPGLYSTDKTKLGRIPKLSKIPKKGQSTEPVTSASSCPSAVPSAIHEQSAFKHSPDVFHQPNIDLETMPLGAKQSLECDMSSPGITTRQPLVDDPPLIVQQISMESKLLMAPSYCSPSDKLEFASTTSEPNTDINSERDVDMDLSFGHDEVPIIEHFTNPVKDLPDISPEEVMLEPVKVNIPDAVLESFHGLHQDSSRGSSCSSSRNSSVERDLNPAPGKCRKSKHLRKGPSSNREVQDLMDSILSSASSLRRNTHRRTDRVSSRSPASILDHEMSSDTEKADVKKNTNIEKRLQKKYDKVHSSKTPVDMNITPEMDDVPLVDKDSAQEMSMLDQIPGSAHHTESISTKRERSVTPEITIPGLGDLPFITDIDHSSEKSKIVFNPLGLTESNLTTSKSAEKEFERSVTSEVTIPGLGDLPLVDIKEDSGKSNVVFNPLRLTTTTVVSSKTTEKERCVTPEVVIPGLGDLPFIDTESNSATSKIVFNPHNLAETSGSDSKDFTGNSAQRGLSARPERIPGLGGHIDIECEFSNLEHLNAAGSATEDMLIKPTRREKFAASVSPVLVNLPSVDQNMGKTASSDSKSSEVKMLGTSDDQPSELCKKNQIRLIETVAKGQVSEPIVTRNTGCRNSVLVPIRQAENNISVNMSKRPATPDDLAWKTTCLPIEDSGVNCRDTVLVPLRQIEDKSDRNEEPATSDAAITGSNDIASKDTDADDGKLVSNPLRRVETAGWEQKLRITIPNNHCGDSSVKLITLDQTIRIILHGHRQFSRLTPSEGLLVNTINTVIHKQVVRGGDQRQVEDTNAEKTKTTHQSSRSSPSMAEFTKNLSPSLVAFAKKHLEPSVSDFTRKHEPDRSDHANDFVSYEQWGSRSVDLLQNEKPENNMTSRLSACDLDSVVPVKQEGSGKANSEKEDEKENTSSDLPSSFGMKYVPASAFIPKSESSRLAKPFRDSNVLAGKANMTNALTLLSMSYVSRSETSTTNDAESSSSSIWRDSPTLTEKGDNDGESVGVKTNYSSTGPSNKLVPSSSDLDRAQSSDKDESSKSPDITTDNDVKSENDEKLPSSTSLSAIPSTLSASAIPSSGGAFTVYSPIRLPEEKKPSTVNKTLISESSKTNQVGAMRSGNLSRKERKAQSHPYTRKRRRNTWSFDIPYRNLQELMRDLTTNTFKQKNLDVPKPQQDKESRFSSRFRNYRFRRSAVPDSLPDSPDDSDEFTADAIPDFEERKRKADMIETMQTNKREDQADYVAEQKIYSPERGQPPKAQTASDDKETADGEKKESILTRLLRISLMPSPKDKTAEKSSSAIGKDGTSKQTSKDKFAQGSTTLKTSRSSSKDMTSLGSSIGKVTDDNSKSDESQSSASRKRRINQTESSASRKDWRESRSRHNTGQGESKHSEKIEDSPKAGSINKTSEDKSKEMGSSYSKQYGSKEKADSLSTSSRSGVHTPSDNDTVSQRKTPSDLKTNLQQKCKSREYSPSEFFSGEGLQEKHSSRENTPDSLCGDNSNDPKNTQKSADLPKKKIRIKRLECNKESRTSVSPLPRDYNKESCSSKSPVTPKIDDVCGPNVFRPIMGPSQQARNDSNDEKVIDLRDIITKQKMKNFQPFTVKAKVSSPSTMDALTEKEGTSTTDSTTSPEENRILVNGAEQMKEVTGQESRLSGLDELSRNYGEPDYSTEEEDFSEWIVVDEFECKEEPQLTDESDKQLCDELSDQCTDKHTKEQSFHSEDMSSSSELLKANTGGQELILADENACGATRTCNATAKDVASASIPGERTILDCFDMNICETEDHDDGNISCSSAFVPIIYLSGTKGSKISWTKELDRSQMASKTSGVELVTADNIAYLTGTQEDQMTNEVDRSQMASKTSGVELVTADNIAYLTGTQEDQMTNEVDRSQMASTTSGVELVTADNIAYLTGTQEDQMTNEVDRSELKPEETGAVDEYSVDNSSGDSPQNVVGEAKELRNIDTKTSIQDLAIQLSTNAHLNTNNSSEILRGGESPQNVKWPDGNPSNKPCPTLEEETRNMSNTYKDADVGICQQTYGEPHHFEQTFVKEGIQHGDGSEDEDDTKNKNGDDGVPATKLQEPEVKVYNKHQPYGYEVEDPSDTSKASGRLNCSWNFTTTEPDDGSSDSLYGEYFTAKTREELEDGTCKGNNYVNSETKGIGSIEANVDTVAVVDDKEISYDPKAVDDQTLTVRYDTTLTDVEMEASDDTKDVVDDEKAVKDDMTVSDETTSINNDTNALDNDIQAVNDEMKPVNNIEAINDDAKQIDYMTVDDMTINEETAIVGTETWTVIADTKVVSYDMESFNEETKAVNDKEAVDDTKFVNCTKSVVYASLAVNTGTEEISDNTETGRVEYCSNKDKESTTNRSERNYSENSIVKSDANCSVLYVNELPAFNTICSRDDSSSSSCTEGARGHVADSDISSGQETILYEECFSSMTTTESEYSEKENSGNGVEAWNTSEMSSDLDKNKKTIDACKIHELDVIQTVEIETTEYGDQDELLLATNTCALLCEVFTAVPETTKVQEMGSTGEDSSQDSSITYNLSFEAEYRESSDHELFELGDYCADLNYRLDRDMDLSHDMQVEHIISHMEKEKNEEDLNSLKQHNEFCVDQNGIVIEENWEAPNELEYSDEQSFVEDGDTYNDSQMSRNALDGSDMNMNTKELTKPSHVYECYNNEEDAVSNVETLEENLKLEQGFAGSKCLPSASVQHVLKEDCIALSPETISSSRKDVVSNNFKGLVPVIGREDYVPDSQEESDEEDDGLLNISNFLKSETTRNYTDLTKDKSYTDVQPSRPLPIVDASSIKDEQLLAQDIQSIKSMKITTPKAPDTDFFGLQTTPNVASIRPSMEYVYGMYKTSQSRSANIIPLKSNLEENVEHEMDKWNFSKSSLNVQNSPLNLSVQSKPNVSVEIPGMSSYASSNCSDQTEDVLGHSTFRPLQARSPTKHIDFVDSSEMKTSTSDSVGQPHRTVSKERRESSDEVQTAMPTDSSDSDTQEQYITAMPTDSSDSDTQEQYITAMTTDSSDSDTQEQYITAMTTDSSDSDTQEQDQTTLITESSDSDTEEEPLSKLHHSLTSVTCRSTDTFQRKQTASSVAKSHSILPEHMTELSDSLQNNDQTQKLSTRICTNEEAMAPTLSVNSTQCVETSDVDFVSTAGIDQGPQTQMQNSDSVRKTQSNQSEESVDSDEKRPCTPVNFVSPQPWTGKADGLLPTPYIPSFWPYSPPLGYSPAFLPCRPPSLQHPLNSVDNYRFWRPPPPPPFFNYSNHGSIPLQQHGIMTSLDPSILGWTGTVRQQLQAGMGFSPPMQDHRLPFYGHYSYPGPHTNVGDNERRKAFSHSVNAISSSINSESTQSQDQSFPHYSNVFMQYVVHRRPVLTQNITPDQYGSNSTRSPDAQSRSAHTSVVSSACQSETGRALTPGSTCSAVNSTRCLSAIENIPLPDVSPPNTSPSTVVAVLPPISTFTRKSDSDIHERSPGLLMSNSGPGSTACGPHSASIDNSACPYKSSARNNAPKVCVSTGIDVADSERCEVRNTSTTPVGLVYPFQK